MFIAEQPRRPRPPLRSAVPTYDVKIIAGRRVVIFHDKKKKQNQDQEASKSEDKQKESPQGAKKVNQSEENSSPVKETSTYPPSNNQSSTSNHNSNNSNVYKTLGKANNSTTTCEVVQPPPPKVLGKVVALKQVTFVETGSATGEGDGSLTSGPKLSQINEKWFGLSPDGEVIEAVEYSKNYDDDEAGGGKMLVTTKAASVPNSTSSTRSRSRSQVPPHPNYYNGRRLSLSDTFTVKSFEEEHSRYKVLPPLSGGAEKSQPEDAKMSVEAGVQRRLADNIAEVGNRTFEVMLRDMRKTDRDRDRVLRPDQISNFAKKFSLNIAPDDMEFLQNKFADKTYDGMTNYEDLVIYLTKIKSDGPKDPGGGNGNKKPDWDDFFGGNNAKSFNDNQTNGGDLRDPAKNPKSAAKRAEAKRAKSTSKQKEDDVFNDRGDAKLIIELEAALTDSPKFDLERFQQSLESKDMYGNGQVSRQHVIQAATNAKLNIPKDVLSRWLSACDPINRGIHSIPKLIDYLERSRPDVVAKQRTKSGMRLSQSHGNISLSQAKDFSSGGETKYKTAETRKPGDGESLSSKSEEAAKSPGPPQNLHDIVYLKQALARSHQEVPGYLSADDLRHVCSSYSGAYQMNISEGRVQEAISNARSMDPATGLINIGLFCRFLDEALARP